MDKKLETIVIGFRVKGSCCLEFSWLRFRVSGFEQRLFCVFIPFGDNFDYELSCSPGPHQAVILAKLFCWRVKGVLRYVLCLGLSAMCCLIGVSGLPVGGTLLCSPNRTV